MRFELMFGYVLLITLLTLPITYYLVSNHKRVIKSFFDYILVITFSWVTLFGLFLSFAICLHYLIFKVVL